MNIRKRDIISIGECFVDFNLKEDGTINRQSVGGDCLTVAAQASRLGSKVDLISAIGLDPFGDYIRSECSKEQINLNYTITVEGYNGMYASYNSDSDLREFAYYRQGDAAKKITPKLILEDHIKSAKIVHSSSITQSISSASRNAVFKAFELCHLHNGMISYDPNLRLRLWSLDDAKQAIWSVLPFIDVIFPSAPDETKALFGYERPIDVIGFLWDHGINVVVVKNGSNGCMVGYDGKIEEIQAENIENPKSYSQIGSAFCGGFLHGISNGLDPFISARIAINVAEHKLKSNGKISDLAKADQISHLLTQS